jgi:hypothetical protein
MSAQPKALEILVSLDDAMRFGLESRGYKVLGSVGEGQTSHALRVEIKGEELDRTAIAKIPKQVIDGSSVRTQANLATVDRTENEATVLSNLRHSHIIGIYDTLLVGEKRVILEEDYNAISLEELVRMNGAITDPRAFEGIFRGVISGLKYLREEKGLIHRDIKPSNILVGKGTSHAKITDLQNAGSEYEESQSPLPTWGGTAYTLPKLLNGALDGNFKCANFRSEKYALGATMYFALTGEHLFNRKLAQGESQRTIEIDGKDIGVILLEDGVEIKKIDAKKHDKYVKQKLRKIPRRLKSLLKDCLLVNKKSETTVSEYSSLEDMFDDATRRRWINWGPVARNVAATVGVAGVVIGLIVGGYWTSYFKKTSPPIEPTVAQLLLAEDFTDADIRYLQSDVNSQALEILQAYFTDIKKRFPEIEDAKANLLRTHSYDRANYAYQNKMSRRLSFSLLRAVAMQDEDSLEEEYRNKRYVVGGVPKDFVHKNMSPTMGSRGGMVRIVQDYTKLSMAVRYLKLCMGEPDAQVVDVYARYFTSKEDRYGAMLGAKSPEYFPTTILERGGEVLRREGYGTVSTLSETQRDLINRSYALYLITDARGIVHLDLINNDGSLDPEKLDIPFQTPIGHFIKEAGGWGFPQ